MAALDRPRAEQPEPLTGIGITSSVAPMTARDFRKHRRRLGLTQVELAARLGKDSMTVSRWERGVYPIPRAIAALMVLLRPETPKKR
jgi:DNA-binding transcriptional regulator YiaG